MANEEHLKLLKQGVEVWNKWREENPAIWPDLTGADLSGANLSDVNLSDADLSDADLSGANLSGAIMARTFLKRISLKDADLTKASLIHSVITFSDLSGAKMGRAILGAANMYEANLKGADLTDAMIDGASLVRTNVENASFTGCKIYGISAWSLKGEPRDQSKLVISSAPQITVDNLEVAQFIYLLLNNEKIRGVIDTITSKVVLILGRFSEDRKPVLDQLRVVLRDRGFAPVLFDFDKPSSKDITGTVETLARMARFIIADLTDPSSIPHELATIVPFMRTTPVVPIKLKGSGGYSMFDDLEAAYNWVLPKFEYENDQTLIESVSDKILDPAVAKVKELQGS